MNIKTKYELGDNLYYIVSGVNTSVEECNLCNSDSKCKQCKGWGYYVKGKQLNYKVNNKPITVKRIDIKVTENKYEVSYLNSTSVSTLYEEDLLFLSFQEAKDECDRRNSADSLNNKTT